MPQAWVQSPYGVLRLQWDAQALQGVSFAPSEPGAAPAAAGSLGELCSRELAAYFAGTRRDFTLPRAPLGTAFQRAVWSAACAIPYGQTCSYADLARACGRPHAWRAVAAALRANPWLIVVPCHRVVGHDGRLCGYAGGLVRKAALLAWEGGFDALVEAERDRYLISQRGGDSR